MQVTRDVGSVPGPMRFPGEGHGNPLQYSCLENPINRGVWLAMAHSVTKSWTLFLTEESKRVHTRAHQLSGHECEQVPGVGDGQGSLMSCSPWGRRVGHDWATELNRTEHTHTHTHTHTGHFNINPKTLLLNVDFIPRFVTSCLVYGSPFLAIVH